MLEIDYQSLIDYLIHVNSHEALKHHFRLMYFLGNSCNFSAADMLKGLMVKAYAHFII
jgi:hypothetical protein